MKLYRSFIFICFIFSIRANFSFPQQAAYTKYSGYVSYSDSLKKILPASDQKFIIEVRRLSDEVLEKYKNDPAFDYNKKINTKEDWITKIRNWINQQFLKLTSTKTYSIILDYFYYGLMLVALILIVRGLIKGDRRGFFFGKPVSTEIEIVEEFENIDQLNFDELIEKYIQSNQYKLAVRYLFLKSLKLLSDNNIIEIKNNKTNRDYLAEIKSRQINDAFRLAMIGFEWIWYGDFKVDDHLMKNSRQNFNHLFGLIKS